MSYDKDAEHRYSWMCVFAAWLIAAVASLGALFLGEVMGVTPCTLCWYQRIAMFPLALMLALALFPLDLRVRRYSIPLALIGALVALYHWLLQLGVIAADLSPCARGKSCAEVDVQWFGWLSLPLLSLLAFGLIVVLLVLSKKRKK